MDRNQKRKLIQNLLKGVARKLIKKSQFKKMKNYKSLKHPVNTKNSFYQK